MPHVIVKLWPGKSQEQKQQLSDQIVTSVMRILGYGEESVSVAMKEMEPDDWKQRDLSTGYSGQTGPSVQETGI